MKILEGDKSASGASIAIVASRYNAYIVDRLISGCLQTLKAGGVSEEGLTLVRVPGAFEIPATVQRIARLKKHDAIIALGAVVRGETPHFDYICNECANGLATAALESGLPVIFGVLTVNTVEQAKDRSGDEESNKGSEAAQTAIEMLTLYKKIS